MTVEFRPFPKIARLYREIIITEKIDGTNASVIVSYDGSVTAASRTRIITTDDDNHGFAAWVKENEDDLRRHLGEGHHFGEWWGHGINRGYGLKRGDKRFSLFNVSRWEDPAARPECCGCVPVIYRGPFQEIQIDLALRRLRGFGSLAAPEFARPEGIIIFHLAANQLFKVTLEKDAEPKGVAT